MSSLSSSQLNRLYPRSSSKNPRSRLTAPDHDMDSTFSGLVRRSFSPARQIMRSASMSYVRTYEQDLDFGETRVFQTPSRFPSYYTSTSTSCENQPFRKYDVYGIRTWSYPIWRYMNNRDPVRKPYLLTTYTPPLMAADTYRRRHAYTDLSYVADEGSFLLADTDRSLNRLHMLSSPLAWRDRSSSANARAPYFHSYAGPGANGVRHFGAYRSRYPSYAVKASWAPYR